MTREKAIEVLKQQARFLKRSFSVHINLDDALPVAIKALEQEPCEDCISRQAVLCEIDKRFDLAKPFKQLIKSMPPVTSKPKTGHWIEEKSEVYKCSNCGRYALEWGGKLKMSRYCPNCGVKMLPTDLESEE